MDEIYYFGVVHFLNLKAVEVVCNVFVFVQIGLLVAQADYEFIRLIGVGCQKVVDFRNVGLVVDNHQILVKLRQLFSFVSKIEVRQEHNIRVHFTQSIEYHVGETLAN